MIETNEPRCELMSRPDGGRCRAQSAGFWMLNDGGRAIGLCEDDRLELEQTLGKPLEWEELVDVGTRARIRSRIMRTAAGYFA